MPAWLSSITGWQFMDEPAWRWFVFVGVILLFLFAWNGVLRYFPR